jgi:hypothetical protein
VVTATIIAGSLVLGAGSRELGVGSLQASLECF